MNSRDFKTIINSLLKGGMTHQKLAEKCSCSMPTIGAIASGKNTDPKYSVGAVLISLSEG
jgi:predicted transcriptional regulator